MKKYRFLSALLLLAVLFSLPVPVSAAQEELDLFCTHAVLLDANHGDILYDKGASERAYPASTTKLTTCLLVMEATHHRRGHRLPGADRQLLHRRYQGG